MSKIFHTEKKLSNKQIKMPIKENEKYLLQAEPCVQKEEELWDDASCDGTGFAQCGQPSPRPLLPPRRQTRQSKEY
jgi:hypothetical protein